MVVINAVIHDKEECITFNDQPITVEELSKLTDKVESDDIDLIVITEGGTEKYDFKMWEDVVGAIIACQMSDPIDVK